MTRLEQDRRTTVRSADGTRIGMTCTGDGPPLILVEPACHHRAFSAFDGLVPLLRSEFTVVTYDRRGRGESADTPKRATPGDRTDDQRYVEHRGGRGPLGPVVWSSASDQRGAEGAGSWSVVAMWG